MVKVVKVFQTDDGKTFPTEKEAKDHEHGVAITGNIQTLLAKLGADGSIMTIGDPNDDSIPAIECLLENFLIDNHVALRDALSGVAVKKPRKPRKQKTGVDSVAEPATIIGVSINEAKIGEAVGELSRLAPDVETVDDKGQKDELAELVAEMGR